MQILIRSDDFSVKHYELVISDTALTLTCKETVLSFPYTEIIDFCVTHDNRGKSYFTMLFNGKLYEGQILNAESVEPFTAALKEKLGGSINIEVKK